jgi:hypothetical protein
VKDQKKIQGYTAGNIGLSEYILPLKLERAIWDRSPDPMLSTKPRHPSVDLFALFLPTLFSASDEPDIKRVFETTGDEKGFIAHRAHHIASILCT